jgi:cyclic pyranopterin phosphate synthase
MKRRAAERGGRLTHFDARGRARMVDVGGKPATRREASAAGLIRMGPAAFNALRSRSLAKGDAVALARAAGIAAAKRTSETIPLCHVVPLDHVGVAIGFDARARAVVVETTARARWSTGVEMEALCAAAAALLTLYDMAKALDRGMVIGPIRLLSKSGGRSGTFRAGGGLRSAAATVPAPAQAPGPRRGRAARRTAVAPSAPRRSGRRRTR